jgi:hypothetical protein
LNIMHLLWVMASLLFPDTVTIARGVFPPMNKED